MRKVLCCGLILVMALLVGCSTDSDFSNTVLPTCDIDTIETTLGDDFKVIGEEEGLHKAEAGYIYMKNKALEGTIDGVSYKINVRDFLNGYSGSEDVLCEISGLDYTGKAEDLKKLIQDVGVIKVLNNLCGNDFGKLLSGFEKLRDKDIKKLETEEEFYRFEEEVDFESAKFAIDCFILTSEDSTSKCDMYVSVRVIDKDFSVESADQLSDYNLKHLENSASKLYPYLSRDVFYVDTDGNGYPTMKEYFESDAELVKYFDYYSNESKATGFMYSSDKEDLYLTLSDMKGEKAGFGLEASFIEKDSKVAFDKAVEKLNLLFDCNIDLSEEWDTEEDCYSFTTKLQSPSGLKDANVTINLEPENDSKDAPKGERKLIVAIY